MNLPSLSPELMSPMPPPFPPEEFRERRATLLERLGPGVHALLQGVGPTRGFDLPRQTNEFHYLSGVAVPQAYLLLDSTARTATLFIPPMDRHEGIADATEEEYRERLQRESGVDEVAPLDTLAARLDSVTVLYTPHSPAEGVQACRDVLTHFAKKTAADPWDSAPSREERFIGFLKERLPQAEIRDLTPFLDDMRLIKSAREVEMMQWSGELCGRAVLEAMKLTRPGLREYHLWAVADYVYRMNGVTMMGYRPILPGGAANTWDAHYFRNDSLLNDGELVLMDYAPDVHNYTSDIGRMWPVNGKYSPLQRELYGFMVRYHKAVLKRIKPGLLPRDILKDAAEEMLPVVEETQFSKPIYEQAARRTLDFLGHLSHPVGMAVHDVGRYFEKPLEVGMVFAVDPQMWIPEEKLYIRVEDTVAVTESGITILTGIVPIELDEMEALLSGSAGKS
jgi:Xaa-Pro aminopeptidase